MNQLHMEFRATVSYFDADQRKAMELATERLESVFTDFGLAGLAAIADFETRFVEHVERHKDRLAKEAETLKSRMGGGI